MNSKIKNTIGVIIMSAGILGAGALCYNTLKKPITYEVFQSNKQEYFSVKGIGGGVYTWEKEIAKKGDTYCQELLENGIINKHVIEAITAQKNNTPPDRIMPGQPLYIAVKVNKKDVPTEKKDVHLEELVGGY
ncbi:MAG: hypothetical protein NTZ02_03970 [Candidatus Woesearchaeota archaeon]|nr:hypothetical protein [Candidatus Woesearchaeota archaeon]